MALRPRFSVDRLDDVPPSEADFQITRKAGPFEVMTHLFHELGIQSNILVAARYSHAGSAHLTPTNISRALEKVVWDHPALSTIGISQPSEKKPGNHQLWEARIPSISLADCVSFIDICSGVKDPDLSQVFENAHNEWLDTKRTTKPWWFLVIVNAQYAVFIYHHSIGDGLSGYTFHRSLLSALNAEEGSEPILECKTDFSKPLTPSPLDQISDKLSWPHVIYTFLFWQLIRFLINQKYFLFSNADYAKTYPTVAKPLPVEEKTTTHVKTLRVKQEEMGKILDACHHHNTSFTALLHTLIQITLATDIYPKAHIGFSRVAVNIRPFLKEGSGKDEFNNAASQYSRQQFLGKYRAAGKGLSKHDQSSQYGLDVRQFWKVASSYKRDMNDFIWKRRTALQDFLTGKLLGEDEEEIGTFYGLGLYQNNGFLISNIGAFEPKDDMTHGGWSITDVGFSAGQIRAALGDAGIVFNVASVKGGDCLVIATYEKGVLEGKMVVKVLEALMARLRLLT
ncbi:alcohol acetyltransferase [Halenospora varia]|nr:alcohol acetyltransferase [Halenospora varia]